MEKTISYVITEGLETTFRSHVEGIIPDLVESARDADPSEGDYDSILDYCSDCAYELFPNVPDENRAEMCRRAAHYFTGGGQ